jgi:hypothetical protein
MNDDRRGCIAVTVIVAALMVVGLLAERGL